MQICLAKMKLYIVISTESVLSKISDTCSSIYHACFMALHACVAQYSWYISCSLSIDCELFHLSFVFPLLCLKAGSH